MFPNDDKFESMFTFESEKGGVIEEKTFRMLILGDWSGDGLKKDFSQRSLIEIDRDNFDSIMNRLQTQLNLDLSDDAGQFLTIEFSELEDFHPDNLYRRISLFADLKDLRRRLVNSDSFNSAAVEVRRWFKANDTGDLQSATSEVRTVDSNELLDQILAGKSESVKLQTQQSAEISLLLKDLVRPYLLDFDENEQKSLISIVDRATSGLMRKILHHPKFQQLEASWRSLYFLVRRAETNTDLKIYILDVGKDQLIDKLKSVNNLDESEIFQKIVIEAKNKFEDDDFAAFFGNYDFLPNVDDIAALIRLGKIGSSIHTPFISRISEILLGVDSFAEINNYRDFNFSSDTNNAKLWTALRTTPEAEYIGLTVNKFLTRLPYGSQTDEIDSFSFEEFDEIPPPHKNYVWGNTTLLCALLFAKSFSKYGWQFGNYFEQDIDEIPVHVFNDGSETTAKPSAEINLTESVCEQLLNYGLMPLICYRNSDKVKLARLQSVTEPITKLAGRWKS